MPDSRYRNGLFTNTRGQNEDKARARRQASLENNPINYGWEKSYWNDTFNQMVYTQGNAKLMYYSEYRCYFVQIGDGHAEPIEGNIKEVTEDVLKGLAKSIKSEV